MNWWKYILIALGGVLVGLFIMWLFQRCRVNPIEPVVIHDTLSVHDTAYIAGKTKTLYVTRWDTLYVESSLRTDSTSDSICNGYVSIPIETKEYRDTFTTDSSRTELAVRFSGYKAKIDSVGLIQEWTIEPKVIDKKKGFRWFVGPALQVGYGIGVNGNTVIASPYVGVGVSIGWGYTFKTK